MADHAHPEATSRMRAQGACWARWRSIDGSGPHRRRLLRADDAPTGRAQEFVRALRARRIRAPTRAASCSPTYTETVKRR